MVNELIRTRENGWNSVKNIFLFSYETKQMKWKIETTAGVKQKKSTKKNEINTKEREMQFLETTDDVKEFCREKRTKEFYMVRSCCLCVRVDVRTKFNVRCILKWHPPLSVLLHWCTKVRFSWSLYAFDSRNLFIFFSVGRQWFSISTVKMMNIKRTRKFKTTDNSDNHLVLCMKLHPLWAMEWNRKSFLHFYERKAQEILILCFDFYYEIA